MNKPLNNLEKKGAAEEASRGTLDKLRYRVIHAAPMAVANSSVFINSAIRIAAEIMMFKASGLKFFENRRGGDKVNYLIDPPHNLFRTVTGIGKKYDPLANRWSTRSTASGFSSYILGSIIPETKIKEKLQKDADGSTECVKLYSLSLPADCAEFDGSPVAYVGQKLFKAVQLGNPDTVREQMGLGVTSAGIFSVIAGLNNISKGPKLSTYKSGALKGQEYIKLASGLEYVERLVRWSKNIPRGGKFINWSQSLGALFTTGAGLSLLFEPEDREGWKKFGAVEMASLPIVLLSCYNKHQGNDLAMEYFSGKMLFQLGAVYSYLFGGVEKLQDGTILDNGKFLVQREDGSICHIDRDLKRKPASLIDTKQLSIESAASEKPEPKRA